MDSLTLYQFKVFLTILEEGSFAAAARRLGRAQSAVSYAVQKLEEQVGLALFDRSVYRPTLTEAGSALVPKVRRIIEDVDEFRVQAKTMTIGVEPQVKLVVDKFLPLSDAIPSLKEFKAAYPFVKLQISSDWGEEAARSLIEDRIDLGIFPLGLIQSYDLEISDIGRIDLVAVASPEHPLAQNPKEISRDELLNHLQIVLGNPKAEQNSRSYGVIALHLWHVSSNQMRRELMLAGLGWGTMPRPMIADDLLQGRLVELEPKQWETGNQMPQLPLILAKRKDKVLWPAASFLMSSLSAVRDTAD